LYFEHHNFILSFNFNLIQKEKGNMKNTLKILSSAVNLFEVFIFAAKVMHFILPQVRSSDGLLENDRDGRLGSRYPVSSIDLKEDK
jgi:hypothetical protein